MTAPRIISAAEAEGLLRHGTDAELAAAAPDLAASVVALHDRAEQAAAQRALLDEAFAIITDGQVDADWEGWCARVVRVLETIKVTP